MHNVMPISGRAGAAPIFEPQEAYPPARSIASAGYGAPLALAIDPASGFTIAADTAHQQLFVLLGANETCSPAFALRAPRTPAKGKVKEKYSARHRGCDHHCSGRRDMNRHEPKSDSDDDRCGGRAGDHSNHRNRSAAAVQCSGWLAAVPASQRKRPQRCQPCRQSEDMTTVVQKEPSI